MHGKNTRRLTPLEALIMDAVWDLGEPTVKDVQDRLAPTKPMAYTTVLTMMRILRAKGALESTRKGRSDVYRPVTTRAQAAKGHLREVVDRFFAGSAEHAVAALLKAPETKLDREQLGRLAKLIERARKEGR
jgi:predicted transcriptional regulator